MSAISNVKLRNGVYNAFINVKDKSWQKTLPNFYQVIDNCLRAVDQLVPLEGSISFLLTNDAEMQTLNKKYKSKDKPTNVLSFPQNEKGLVGDVIIALETVQAEAHEQEKSFYDHFCHMVVHGVLHLKGYDHEKSKKAQKEMEALEIEVLSSLGVDDPFN
jgi:probable rRNA maturation factor